MHVKLKTLADLFPHSCLLAFPSSRWHHGTPAATWSSTWCGPDSRGCSTTGSHSDSEPYTRTHCSGKNRKRSKGVLFRLTKCVFNIHSLTTGPLITIMNQYLWPPFEKAWNLKPLYTFLCSFTAHCCVVSGSSCSQCQCSHQPCPETEKSQEGTEWHSIWVHVRQRLGRIS